MTFASRVAAMHGAFESGLKLNPASSEALAARARLRAAAPAIPEGGR
jgi:hypothetical protein